MTEKICIFLNSRTSDMYINDNTADCVFFLPIIHVPKHRKVFCSVQTCSFAHSFYNINEFNNTLKYSVNGGSTQTLIITEGNYNVSNLMTLLNSELIDFTVTYDNKINHLIFKHSTYDFVFYSNSTCFEILGFKEVLNLNYNSLYKTLNSNISLNLFTTRCIYVSSDNFQLNNINNSTPNKNNILCSIPVDSGHGSMIIYSNIYGIDNLIHHVNNLTQLHIKLTDQDDNTLNLNGTHWSMTLQLTIE